MVMSKKKEARACTHKHTHTHTVAVLKCLSFTIGHFTFALNPYYASMHCNALTEYQHMKSSLLVTVSARYCRMLLHLIGSVIMPHCGTIITLSDTCYSELAF